jgi:hypothetical protein
MFRLRFIIVLIVICAVTYAIFVSLVICTKDDTPPRVAPELKALVEEWEWDMRDAGLDYTQAFNRLEAIELSSPNAPYAGVADLSTRKIKINPKQLGSGRARTKATLYHELGHFVFALDHVEGTIMQEKCPSEEELQENWEDYINEYLELCNNNSFNAKY